MKLKLTVILISCCITLVNAQNTPTTTDSLSKEVRGIKDQIANLKKLMTENSKDQSIEVGTLKLKNTENIQVYQYSSGENKIRKKDNHFRESRKVDIDSIRVISKDGYMVAIYVHTRDKGIFLNYNAPIELSQERISNEDMLSNGSNEYLNIADILLYSEKRKFIPSNDNVLLTIEAPSHIYKKGTGLNTIFDLRLYSDALGIFGGKSNGLVQADASLKYIFHRQNIRNLGIFFVNYLKFNFTASKFDSKVGFTDSTKFSRTSLFQKSFIHTDVALNLFNGWIGKRTLNSYYLDAGAGISLSNLAKKTDTTALISSHFFLEPGVSFDVSDNLGISVYSRFIYNYNYSAEIDHNIHGGKRVFIKPTFSIFWNPIENKASKIFARVSYVTNTADKPGNFCQIQFGYSLQLSSLAEKL